MVTGKINKIFWAGFFITLAGSILFSTKAIIVKKAFADIKIDALTLLALRMVFSLPFYLFAAIHTSSKKENVKMNSKQWMGVIILGVCGYYLSSLFDFLGLQYVSAGLERLILFLYPTFAVLINAFVFKVRMSRTQKIALACTYSGILVAYVGELNLENPTPLFLWGSFLIFLCAVTFSIYIVGSGKMIPSIGATKFTAYAMLVATAGILLQFIIRGNYTKVHFDHHLFVYGLLLALIATVVPSFLISAGMKRIGSNNVAIVSSIGPVSTIIQAYFILGEKIFAAQIFGTVLVIIGVLLIGWRTSKN
ncbi:MAG: EamA family transporter [Bacteroidetes bacterium]|nr:MAG: EamA family transporter [Bacteroidota bacterium]